MSGIYLSKAVGFAIRKCSHLTTSTLLDNLFPERKCSKDDLNVDLFDSKQPVCQISQDQTSWVS